MNKTKEMLLGTDKKLPKNMKWDFELEYGEDEEALQDREIERYLEEEDE